MTMREGGTLPPSHGRRYPEGAEVGSLSGMKKWEAPLIGHGGEAATTTLNPDPKNRAPFCLQKETLFFYNVRPISTAICLSLSGERPAMVR